MVHGSLSDPERNWSRQTPAKCSRHHHLPGQPRFMIGLIIGFLEFEGCLCLMEADIGRDAEGQVVVKAWKGKIGEGQCSPKRKAAFLQHWH